MNLLFLALVAQVHLALQHLTYQDLSQSVLTLEGKSPWGQGVASLHLKDDRFLQRQRLQWEGAWRAKPWPLTLRWSHLWEHRLRHRSQRTTGEVRVLWRRGTWRVEPGLLGQRFRTSPETRYDVGPLLRARGTLLQGQADLFLRYTSLFRRASFGWQREGPVSGRLHLLDFRYPLSRETEHQQEAHLELSGRLGGAQAPGEIRAGVIGEHRRFRWDQVRSGDLVQGFFRVEVHRRQHRLGLEVRRQAFRFTRFSGLSRVQEHLLYASTQQPTHLGVLEASLQLHLQRRDPPGVFAFNRRDRRVLRTEARWQGPANGSLHWNLHFVGKLTDEVFLHPTRSAYTRQDQSYRLIGTVEAAHWIHTTEIAALYALYRFAPERNLLLRYLLTRLEVPASWFRLDLRFRWQQNGTYHEATSGWFFFLRRETVEGRAHLRILAFRRGGYRLWGVAELLDRQERAPGEVFQRRQWERAAGFRAEGPGLTLEIKRVRRNRESAFWSATLSWEINW